MLILCLCQLLGFAQDQPISFDNCKKCIVLAEQAGHRIAILDLTKKQIVWDWLPKSAIVDTHLPWFNLPSEVKPVKKGTCILMTASGGAVALIRIADKKVLFYAYAGGNPHSAELLPDGNIVTASSHGNCLTVFKVDTLQQPSYQKKITVTDGHNVVWDRKRHVLWTAANNQLLGFSYNFNREQPELIQTSEISLPGKSAHDLFPVFGEDKLWLSNTDHLYQYDFRKRQLQIISTPYRDIKSISSGRKGNQTLVIYPSASSKSWWTDEISTLSGDVLFKENGLKIYKARWFLPNRFSY